MNLNSRRPGWLLAALLAGTWLLAGCAASLCTKHLFLFRDTEHKQPPSQSALLITDPNLANAVLPQPAGYSGGGYRWAPEQLAQDEEGYRLSIERVDDRPVYQGLCMDTLPTYAVEVRPGQRRVLLRFDLYGPWGQEKIRETAPLNLEPGRCYFLRPDVQAMKEQRLVLKVDQLPDPYTPQLRARIIDYKRRSMKGIDQ